MGDPIAEGQRLHPTYFPLALVLLAFNLISAGLFIATIHHPVYDDGFNIFDVHNYAVNGLSHSALLAQRNPPGPTSFVWMAAAVRLLGGDELRDARIGALFSWLLLGIGVFLGARFSRYPELWYGALIALLVFPHAVEGAAEVLTEGPALFFAVIGALAWTEFADRADLRAATLITGILGCVFMGLAVTCRQYNIALLPAAAVVACLQFRAKVWDSGEKWRWASGALFSLALSALPVLLLVMAWKGIASPGMESGTSYNMMYKAGAGLNIIRPVIAALYAAFYLFPFTFPLMLRPKSAHRVRILAIAAAAGLAAGFWSDSLIQPGPLNTVLNVAARFSHGPEILFGLLVAVAICNLISLGVALWERRSFLISSSPVAFAFFVIVFFVFEQFGVGGNIPFYDRYVIQLAPFIGIVAFALLPSLSKVRLSIFAAMSVVSHVMLWRYAFSS